MIFRTIFSFLWITSISKSDSNQKLTNGIFGHFNFESIQYFDTLKFDPAKRQVDIPDANFTFYKFVLAIDHFKDEIYLLHNSLVENQNQLDELETLMNGE